MAAKAGGGRKAAPAKPKPVKRGFGQGGEGTPLISTPAANTAATITVPATAGRLTSIRDITLSYNAAPAALGRLTVVDGAATVLDIVAAGPLHLPFSDGIMSAARNPTWTVTLAAAGAAVTGKLNVRYAPV